MKESEEILDTWYKSISSFKQLSYSETQAMYLQMLNEEDKNKKQELRDKLINGTLYVVYKNLKSYKYAMIKTSDYDMNDIISTSIIAWINIIDSGKLLEFQNFSSIFNTFVFYNNLKDNLFDRKYRDILTREDFGLLIYKFIKQNEKTAHVDYQQFKEFVKNLSFQISDDYINYLYNALQGFCTYLHENDIDSEFSKRQLQILRHFVINVGNNLEKQDIQNVKIENTMEQDFEDKQLKENLLNILNSDVLRDKEKLILFNLYFAGKTEKISCEEIMKKLNISHGRIFQIRDEAICKIRKHIKK